MLLKQKKQLERNQAYSYFQISQYKAMSQILIIFFFSQLIPVLCKRENIKTVIDYNIIKRIQIQLKTMLFKYNFQINKLDSIFYIQQQNLFISNIYRVSLIKIIGKYKEKSQIKIVFYVKVNQKLKKSKKIKACRRAHIILNLQFVINNLNCFSQSKKTNKILQKTIKFLICFHQLKYICYQFNKNHKQIYKHNLLFTINSDLQGNFNTLKISFYLFKLDFFLCFINYFLLHLIQLTIIHKPKNIHNYYNTQILIKNRN
ncbi:transmembrane protein, putative (macronuclear) [Tetrahymena thermophila SB210]|uniref:Transmembrane protein, putative n=1 Tax=Tetrahymena thermophila (strain SB210) TaxID=312017 RepID=W7XCU3_TETTS|nr:transmembrane protein, putative [Tetrahymena thermophila SB210]EWS74383.1 transmembrane protein, putative [Tetrahymena thermophila SB210]|eukprot:XP_012653060.1 transmembrane protein, putative [Tetrahymena thermophila SB210]